MIRSQSLSSLNEQKKSRGNFLNSLISRKSSQTELNENKNTKTGRTNNTRKQRPLSQSFSSMNLKTKLKERNDVADSTGYISALAKQRQVAYGAREKENIGQHGTENTVQRTDIQRGRSIRMRSSVPNLNHRYKRNSVLIGLPESTTSVINIYADNNTSTRKPLSKKPSVEFQHLNGSLDGQSSRFESLDFELEASEEMIEEGLEPKKLHRTTNINNISDFLKMVQEEDSVTNDNFIPINNRKSLEFESIERDKLRISLQGNLDREEAELPLTYSISLVQSVMFFTLESKPKEAAKLKFLHDYDYDYQQCITQDSYDDDSNGEFTEL